MKIRIILLLIFQFVFVVCVSQETSNIDSTKYIVLSDAYFWSEREPNTILVITDEDEINVLTKIYENERFREYKNGYSHRIYFFDDSNKLLYNELIQTETDLYRNYTREILDITNEIVERKKSNPTYYVYNLRMDVTIPLDSIIEVFRKDGLKTLFLNDTLLHYPKYRLVYYEHTDALKLGDAEASFIELEKQIKFSQQPIYIDDIYRDRTSRAKYSDSTINLASRIYFFSKQIDEQAVFLAAKSLGIENLFFEKCYQDFYLQLLLEEDEVDVDAIKSKYPFVKSVIKADRGFQYWNPIVDYYYYDEDKECY